MIIKVLLFLGYHTKWYNIIENDTHSVTYSVTTF